jgi:hypothetical protein
MTNVSLLSSSTALLLHGIVITMQLRQRTNPPRRIRKNPVAIPLARCARLYRATGSASSWQGAFQPRCIPRTRSFAAWTTPMRSASGHLTGGDFALPTAPIEQGVPPLHPDHGVPPVDPDEGPCPIDPREARAALTHPARPCAGRMPRLRACRAAAAAKAEAP